MSEHSNLPGLPEGLEAVRWGKPEQPWEFHCDLYNNLMRENPLPFGLVVRAAEGWHIVVSSKINAFAVERVNEPAKIMTLRLVLRGSESEAAVRRVLAKLVWNNGVEVEGGTPPNGSVEVEDDKV
jgi:hypothetical protein